MKLEDKVIKLISKNKFIKANNILISKRDQINIKEFYEKFVETEFENIYEYVKVLVDANSCYNTQLENDYCLFNAIYNSLDIDFERVLDAGANPNKSFYINQLGRTLNCIDLVKYNSTRRDKLILFMKKSCDVSDKEFDNYNDKNYRLVHSYCEASIDLKPRFVSEYGVSVSRDEYNKKNIKCYSEKEIKEFAKIAKYGVIKLLKDAINRDEDDDKTLERMKELNEQIDKDEAEYLSILQEKEELEKQQKEQVKASRQKTEDLISEIEDKIFDEM